MYIYIVYNDIIMKYKNGFTVAELLVSLLIVSVIGTAMVPVIGPKKILSHQLRMAHGVFECFYDDSGNLHAFTANDSNNRRGTAVPTNGDSCNFTPPRANFYFVQVIGAGGDGGGEAADASYEIFKKETDPKKITVLDSFSDDIKKAPAEIQKLFNKKAKFVAFHIYSPAGENGKSKKQNGTLSGTNTEDDLQGQKGGYGRIGVYGTYYNTNTKIKSSNGIKESFSSPWVEVKNSADGKDFKAQLSPAKRGEDVKEAPPGTFIAPASNNKANDGQCLVNGKRHNCNNNGPYGEWWTDDCVADPSAPPDVLRYCKYQPSTEKSSVEPCPTWYEYTSPIVYMRANYGRKGEEGARVSKIYSNFNGESLLLRPAKRYENDNGERTSSQLYTIDADTKQPKLLLQARSGAKGDTVTGVDLPLVIDTGTSTTDKFPSSWQGDVLSTILNQVISYNAIKLSSGMNNVKIGAPGSGAYPMLINERVDLVYKLYEMWGVGGKEQHEVFKTDPGQYDMILNENASTDCLDSIDKPESNTHPINGKDQYYCPAQRGGGGAVVISW